MGMVLLFSIMMMGFSLLMIVDSNRFARGIVRFSEQTWFHIFEVLSRLVFGLGFLVAAKTSAFALLYQILGIGLVLVGFGLSLTKEQKHRHFAVFAAQRFKNIFPFAGFCSLIFAVLLIYTVIK